MIPSYYTCLLIFALSTLLSMNLLLTKVTSSFEPDKISSLPGQPSVKFQQFGGYITVNETENRNLFYYFVEAESNPSSKPLVLWLSGGPGCSSVGIAFLANGPFKTVGDELLFMNDYSWNKEVNVLFVESPAGVGFSYSKNKSYYIGVNDEMTAKDNLVFLQNWLVKYVEYKNRDFFITGTSYAGHFVPQLANLILNSSLKLNLKGIAIGNPVLDFDNDFNPRADYLWSHGLISDETFKLLQTTCSYAQLGRQQHFKGSMTPPCALVFDRMTFEFPAKLVDKFDILHDDHCPYYQLPHHIHMLFNLRQMNDLKLGSCHGDEVTKYLNRKDVQKALNARLIGVTTWKICSNKGFPNPTITYNMDDLFNNSILPLLGKLIKAGIRVLVYSGDQDSVVSFIGTRSLINGLAKELNLKTTVPYQFWLVNEEQEVGGWFQEYDHILSYAVVRGASHGALSSQPLRSQVLLRSFLSGKAP